MNGAKERVIEELGGLRERVDKLRGFLISDKAKEISAEMRDLLNHQYTIMVYYIWTLEKRLEIWGNK